MVRTVETQVFKFNELSDRAKERARGWFRSIVDTADYAETVIEDAANIADILGINLRTRRVNLMGGGTRLDPCVYWSGFSSQGDGACFEGSYSYKKGAAKKLREHAPQDRVLHGIADELQAIQAKNFYALSASTCNTRGNNMSVDVERTDDRPMTDDAEETVAQALREFADWIYRQLEKEYEYQMSDEVVDESIEINEYEFDEDGERA